MKLKKNWEEQFKKYRRSWDIAPPAITPDSKHLLNFSPLNNSIPTGMIPFTESLKILLKELFHFSIVK